MSQSLLIEKIEMNDVLYDMRNTHTHPHEDSILGHLQNFLIKIMRTKPKSYSN